MCGAFPHAKKVPEKHHENGIVLYLDAFWPKSKHKPLLNVPIKAKHRNRSRVRKCLWAAGAAGTLGTAVNAMGQDAWDQNLSTVSPFNNSTGYQTSHNSGLETIHLNPATIRLLDNLFLDAGLDAMSPSLALGQYYYSSSPATWSNGFENQVNADGNAWGNIGLTWDITKHQHLAVTYRSPMDDDYSGHFTMDPWAAGAGAISSSFNSALGLPAIVGIGYGLALTETISLGADFAWLDFSRYKSSGLDAGNAVLFALAGKTASTSQPGHSTLASGVGTDWKFAEHWILRAGYQFFENPVHSSAFSPTIPDVNMHVFTLGLGWKGKRSSLELAYALDFYYDRHIANDQQPGFDGSYGFNGHLLSLAYKFSF